jgi:hypothetical protein
MRMPLDRVGRPGLLSQAGAVSMGSACVAHGYFWEVPATTSIFIANPTSVHVIVRVGTRVGSIAPTHLDADVPLTIGAVFMQDNTSWVDFDNVKTDMSPVLDTVTTVRLAPADVSTRHPRERYKQTLKFTPTLMHNNAHASENSYSLLPLAPQVLHLYLAHQMTLDAQTKNGPVISMS